MNRIATRLAIMAAACFCGVTACGNTPKGTIVRQAPVETRQDPQLGERDLFRDLEAAVLENYLQLTLGNMEAYADSVARDREVVLIGVSPDTLVTGTNAPERSADRRPFKERARPTCNNGGLAPESNGPEGSGAEDGRSDAPASKEPPEESGAAPKPEGFPADASTALDVVSSAGQAEDYDRTVLPCARFVPKTLDLHLARDGSAGWIADEIDYRVPHQGREAAIPLRFTAVLVRDIDRWVVVMEHISYALPLEDSLEMANAGALSQLDAMNGYVEDRNLGRILPRQVQLQLEANGDAKARRVAELTQRYSAPLPEEPGAYRVPAETYLLLLPFRNGEYRGEATFQAPTLFELLATRSTTPPQFAIDEVRLFVSASKQVAWMAANLQATLTLPDGSVGPTPRRVTIPLRGTFVFALDSFGWNVVQSHLSVPVTESQLAGHIFGDSSLNEGPTSSELARKRDRAP